VFVFIPCEFCSCLGDFSLYSENLYLESGWDSLSLILPKF
jgi:hypothetical protein